MGKIANTAPAASNNRKGAKPGPVAQAPATPGRPSLASPAARKDASKAADVILGATRPGGRPAKGPAATQAPQAAKGPAAPVPGSTVTGEDGNLYVVTASGGRVLVQSRAPKKRRLYCNATLRIAYLADCGPLENGRILVDFPGLYEEDEGKLYTVVVMSPKCDTPGPRHSFAYGLFIGETGGQTAGGHNVDDIAAHAAFVAQSLGMDSGGDYCNGPALGWISLEDSLSESEIKALNKG